MALPDVSGPERDLLDPAEERDDDELERWARLERLDLAFDDFLLLLLLLFLAGELEDEELVERCLELR